MDFIAAGFVKAVKLLVSGDISTWTYEEQLANADVEVEYDDITGEELAQIEGGSNE